MFWCCWKVTGILTSKKSVGLLHRYCNYLWTETVRDLTLLKDSMKCDITLKALRAHSVICNGELLSSNLQDNFSEKKLFYCGHYMPDHFGKAQCAGCFQEDMPFSKFSNKTRFRQCCYWHIDFTGGDLNSMMTVIFDLWLWVLPEEVISLVSTNLNNQIDLGSLSWKCYFIKYSILGLFSMINIHCISWKLFWDYF